MASRSAPKNPAPKLKKAREVKPAHPSLSAAVENAFYFVQTALRLYSTIDYFKTFDPNPSDRQKLHSHWTNARQILLNSPEQQYFDQGRRLKLCWESPGNGLGAFWQEQEDAKSSSDIQDAARDNIRKHSIRSTEHNVLGAIHNLDDQSRSKRVRKEKKKAHGKENTDPEHITMKNIQSSHATGPYTKSRDESDNDTRDSEVHQSCGSPEAFDADQLQDELESLANINCMPTHGPQEALDAHHASKGDNAGGNAGDDDDLLS
ncbi:hypothetical protein BGZ76_002526 [Entomortierella beljakovae]|nr:hypothetical protein BGZ76_002526 [Entomortierella beljakovae]